MAPKLSQETRLHDTVPRGCEEVLGSGVICRSQSIPDTGIGQQVIWVTGIDFDSPPDVYHADPQVVRLIFIGVSQYEVYKANPHACRGISARYLTYRQQHTEQQRQNLGEEASRIVFQLRSQGLSPGLGRVASHLSHAGSLRKPEMRKLVRELCQAGGQSNGVMDDPHREMEA
jgi:hypothetical protein